MTATLPAIARRHSWPDELKHVVSAHETRDGNEHHIKQCVHCGMTRITIIPPHGFAWHEWVTPEGKLWVGELVPPCGAQVSDSPTPTQARA